MINYTINTNHYQSLESRVNIHVLNTLNEKLLSIKSDLSECFNMYLNDISISSYRYVSAIKKIKYILSIKPLMLLTILLSESKIMDDIALMANQCDLYSFLPDDMINNKNASVFLKNISINNLSCLVNVNKYLKNTLLLQEIELIKSNIKYLSGAENNQVLIASIKNQISIIFNLFTVGDIDSNFDEELINLIDHYKIYNNLSRKINLKQLIYINDYAFDILRYNNICNKIQIVNMILDDLFPTQFNELKYIINCLKDIVKSNRSLLCNYFIILDRKLCNELINNINRVQLYSKYTNFMITFDSFISINLYLID